MQLIKEFEYWECTPASNEKKFIGIKQIKEELRYPAIKFLNSEGKKNRCFRLEKINTL